MGGSLVEEVLPQLSMMTEEPDHELYNFHKASGKPVDDLGPEDFQKILAKLPPDLATRVEAEGLDTLKMLLSGKLPAAPPRPLAPIPPELLATLPPEIRTLPPEQLMATLQKLMARGGPGAPGLPKTPGAPPPQLLSAPPGPPMVPPVLRAAVDEVLAGGGGELDGDLAKRWEERQAGVRLLQTVCKLLAGVLLRNWYSVKPQLFRFLEMLALNESSELEPDLARDCNVALACLSTCIVPLNVLPIALTAIEQVSQSQSWKAKIAMLEYLQVHVFTNMAVFHAQKDQASRVIEIVTRLIKDDRIEVREKAGKVLGGMLHCCFISEEVSLDLLAKFKQEVSKKIRKKPKENE